MSLKKKLTSLDTLVQKGEFVAAVEQFFDDNVQTMSQGDTFMTHSKTEKLATLGFFFANIAQTNEIKHYFSKISGNTTESYFTFDFTNLQGERLVWHENIRRQWSKVGFVLSETYIGVENIIDLQQANKAEVTLAKKAKISKNTPKNKHDDLKKIEGIGPKIEKLLQESGITTYEALSLTSLEKMQLILKAAGSRYQMHDPSTWAAQAALAHRGDWEQLSEWQLELIGGKISK